MIKTTGASRVDRMIAAVLKPISRGVTVVIAVYTFVWGLWVINPFWHVFDTAPLYSGMNAVAPEWFWGLFALVASIASFITSVSNRWKPHAIFTCAAITGWHWFIVGLMYLYGDWHNTGGITALFLSFLCAYIFINVKQNQGYK